MASDPSYNSVNYWLGSVPLPATISAEWEKEKIPVSERSRFGDFQMGEGPTPKTFTGGSFGRQGDGDSQGGNCSNDTMPRPKGITGRFLVWSWHKLGIDRDLAEKMAVVVTHKGDVDDVVRDLLGRN